jgi:2-haloalkanoic acid dehalogenase type II
VDWSTLSFDCYGTLVDWESGIDLAFREAAAAAGVELSREAVIGAYHAVEPEVQAGAYRPYREVLRETALRVAARLGWPLSASQAGFLADSLPSWPPFPDTRAALERLGARYRLGVLSNIDDDLLEATLAALGVEFDWLVTAQQLRSYKPAAPHFREALRRVPGGRARLLHLAQSQYHDIRPAAALGIAAVWVNRKRELRDVDSKPLHEVGDLLELANWLGC